ncbi:MAG TPA: hypothetical protein VLB80_01235 [Candidatus Babeliales bacterium]|nr:hypothetical protein [Candidatus Babeliales bacterium]
MQHSPMMKMLGMATWAITGLASINMLTGLYGYDVFDWLMITMPGAVVPLVWIVGLSGVISLAMLIKVSCMCCPGCGSCPCTCQ